MRKSYNWIYRKPFAPEPIYIPISTSQKTEGRAKEAYELTEIYKRLVKKEFHYSKIRDLADPLIEKAAKESSRGSHKLIEEVKEYLLNFIRLMDDRDDSGDIYKNFRRGLKKVISNHEIESVQFVKTLQNSSILSEKVPQHPTVQGKQYHPSKGDLEDYTQYWKEVPERYDQFYKFFH